MPQVRCAWFWGWQSSTRRATRLILQLFFPLVAWAMYSLQKSVNQKFNTRLDLWPPHLLIWRHVYRSYIKHPQLNMFTHLLANRRPHLHTLTSATTEVFIKEWLSFASQTNSTWEVTLWYTAGRVFLHWSSSLNSYTDLIFWYKCEPETM